MKKLISLLVLILLITSCGSDRFQYPLEHLEGKIKTVIEYPHKVNVTSNGWEVGELSNGEIFKYHFKGDNAVSEIILTNREDQINGRIEYRWKGSRISKNLHYDVDGRMVREFDFIYFYPDTFKLRFADEENGYLYEETISLDDQGRIDTKRVFNGGSVYYFEHFYNENGLLDKIVGKNIAKRIISTERFEYLKFDKYDNWTVMAIYRSSYGDDYPYSITVREFIYR